MKKNVLCLLLALGLITVLAACGESGGQPSQPAGGTAGSQSQPVDGTSQTPEGYVFPAASGYSVAISDNMADVLNVLGEANSYFQAESCAFEGLDKTYTYSGFIITTRPDGDQDLVQSIQLTDDSVTTKEGVYIGSSASDVTAAYGDSDSVVETLLTYTIGETTLNFVLENGVVISIEYLYNG